MGRILSSMFPYRTLLILGAGASRPYLFPTARELTNLILERGENAKLLENMGFNTDQFQVGHRLFLQSPDNILYQYRDWFEKRMQACGVEKHELEQFQKRFRLSGSYSIDAFVADNPFYTTLASLMIATILLKCEQDERLEGDLYQLLFNELIDEHGKGFPADTLSIITFNYDRSLEMYLHRAFMNRYDLTSAIAWSLIKRLEIIHVYGSLGPLFDDNGSREMGYGANAIRPAAEFIRLVGPRADSEHLISIRALIDRSPRIVFLGFGFDRLNLTQIQIPPSSNRKVFASCCGLSSPAMARAESALRQGDPSSGWITWGARTDTATDFLNNSLALV